MGDIGESKDSLKSTAEQVGNFPATAIQDKLGRVSLKGASDGLGRVLMVLQQQKIRVDATHTMLGEGVEAIDPSIQSIMQVASVAQHADMQSAASELGKSITLQDARLMTLHQGIDELIGKVTGLISELDTHEMYCEALNEEAPKTVEHQQAVVGQVNQYVGTL